MLTLELLLSNVWLLIAAIAAVAAALITVLYFRQEKINAMENHLEQLENK